MIACANSSSKGTASFFGVEHIGEFVYSELFENARQLFFQNVSDAELNGSFKSEVQRANDMFLTDTIDTADSLFDLHRVPRQIVIHDDMAELKIKTLAAGIG